MTKKETTAAKRARLTPKAIALVEEGLSVNEIACKLGVDRGTVRRWLTLAGAPHPDRRRIPDGTTNAERLSFGTGSPDRQTGCIPWLRSKDKHGYGHLTPADERLKVGAHRLALELKIGRRLVHGEVTRHTCDNPSCVNPAHLVVGTHADNSQDMGNRRRQWNQNKYDSPEQVSLRAHAFALLRKGRTQTEVALVIGVHQGTISRWLKQTQRKEPDHENPQVSTK